MSGRTYRTSPRISACARVSRGEEGLAPRRNQSGERDWKGPKRDRDPAAWPPEAPRPGHDLEDNHRPRSAETGPGGQREINWTTLHKSPHLTLDLLLPPRLLPRQHAVQALLQAGQACVRAPSAAWPGASADCNPGTSIAKFARLGAPARRAFPPQPRWTGTIRPCHVAGACPRESSDRPHVRCRSSVDTERLQDLW